MLSSIAKGYKKLFSTLGIILLLALCCAVLGAVIVFPLWKWATGSAKTYTVAVAAVFILLFLFVLYRQQKKSGTAVFIKKAAKVLTVLLGIFLCLMFLYLGHRVAFFITIPATLLVYGIISFGFQKK